MLGIKSLLTASFVTLFWKKVTIPGPDVCWEWQASLDGDGYGMYRGRLAHRVSWALHYDDPGDLHVLHQCDNPRCVNPRHLFLGTHKENMADRAIKERGATNKLTGTDVADIIARINKGELFESIGAIYGVSKSAIRSIAKGTTWKHLNTDDLTVARPSNKQGGQNSQAKLTEDDVRRIRTLYPRYSQTAIAEAYGITQAAVGYIIRRKTWKHVKD